jgi:protease-4
MALLPSLSGCFFISGNINPFGGGPAPLEERVVAGIGKEKIVLIDVERTITAEEQQQAFGLRRRESTVARVEEELQKAAGDERVRAIVLRINSPGGSVTASDVIYHRLRQFAQERRVPIVAHMGDVAASGGYYVALAADEIVASPTSVTGSIGVILFGVNVEGLMSKLGVSNQTFKAGAHKDIGSPLRPMTKEESAILQTVLDSLQARFVGLVRERRPQFSGDAAYVDGRILTAEQALAGKLIDRIGYLDDALNAARQRAQLTQARVVMYRRPGEWGETIYSRAPLSGDTQVNLSLLNVDMSGLGFGTPRFMYLWWPAAE